MIALILAWFSIIIVSIEIFILKGPHTFVIIFLLFILGVILTLVELEIDRLIIKKISEL
jgi:hypothetical protein